MKLLSRALLAFLLSSSATANESFRVLKEFDVEGGKAILTVSERAHVLGQPFHLELRVNCSNADVEIENLPVHDSFSVCDMQPESIKVNTLGTAIAMKTKMANVDKYYDLVGEGRVPASVPCKAKTEVMKFTLKGVCSSN